MKLKKILRIILIICLILITIDQTSKVLINHNLQEDVELIPGFLNITKVKNEGMAFGINKQNLGNIGLTIIILVAIFNYIISQKENMNAKIIIFLSFIIAGGISNLIDRIFKGAVFDFIQIGEFPVFNIADCFIVIRLVIICYKFYCFF